jgi:rare lipoprotein A
MTSQCFRVFIGPILFSLGFSLQAKSEETAGNGRGEKQADVSSQQMRGSVSFYGQAFAGRKTASGERFDPQDLTMAHRSLPFGTWVRVSHLKNKKSVIVRVNDRGPFVKSRLGDLSLAAAHQIGMVRAGVAWVTLSVVTAPAKAPPKPPPKPSKRD